MSKLLLPLFYILSFSALGQTSVYYPFPDSNAVWNINVTVQFPYSQKVHSHIIAGDTAIKGYSYHKIISTAIPYSPQYRGSIRQDTAGRKVYIVPPNDSTEQLLYDFTMPVGAPVQGYIKSFCATPDSVQSIDSVLIGGNYRKRWSIKKNNSIYLIEGIGSTWGLVDRLPIWSCAVDGNTYMLTCFEQNGVTLYPNSSTTCDFVTDIYNSSDEESAYRIFPNPATTHITINRLPNLPTSRDNPSKAGALMSLVIADLFGRVVHQSEIINNTSPAGRQESEMDVSALPSGVYVVVVREEEKVYRCKFVKQ